jgi:hypothetical protein
MNVSLSIQGEETRVKETMDGYPSKWHTATNRAYSLNLTRSFHSR